MEQTCSLDQLLLLVFRLPSLAEFAIVLGILLLYPLEQLQAAELAYRQKSQSTSLPVIFKCLAHLRFDPDIPLVERLESCLNLLVELIAVAVPLDFDKLVLLRMRQEEGEVCHLEELLVTVLLLTNRSFSSFSLSAIRHHFERASRGLGLFNDHVSVGLTPADAVLTWEKALFLHIILAVVVRRDELPTHSVRSVV